MTTPLFMPGRIISEVPACVMSVDVNVGERVSRGQVLLLLESMKMEIPVVCQHDSSVKEIVVSVGDFVATKQHLLTLVNIAS